MSHKRLLAVGLLVLIAANTALGYLLGTAYE